MVTAPGISAAVRLEAGYSLVELLMAMAVSLAVVGGAALLAGQMQMAYGVQLETAAAQQEGRYVLQQIERHLRGAGHNPYELSITPCPSPGTPVEAIRLDPDGDGVNDDIRVMRDANPPNGRIGGVAGSCTEAEEDVLIFHDPVARVVSVRDMNRQAQGVPLTGAVVTALEFVYRTAERVVTANPAQVAFIEIRVTVETRANDPNLGGPVSQTLASEVRVRTR